MLLAGAVFNANAQNKILLINGKTIETEHFSLGDDIVSYRKSSKKSLASVDRYDVFSITDTSGLENVIYKPADSLDYTVEEARVYIQGEQIAMKYYNRPSTAWTSAAVGAGSSILLFYSLPIPMVYSVILGRFNPKVKGVPAEIPAEVVQSQPFVAGYQRSARNLKIQRSLKWGYISLGVGLAGWLIYSKAND